MKLENRIRIQAPQSTVWSVTENIEQWPKWAPTVDSVKRLDEGPFKLGSAALLKQPGLPETEWRVTALKGGLGFTWEARVRGMRMVASHELSPVGDETDNVLRLEVSGVVAIFLWPILRGALRKALEQENAGLKAECES